MYLNPPDRALVLCVDEKSQIQALDRTAPILPLRPGLPERQTHDYKRHGTTTLFAAFNILNGKVIGTCQDRHRSREFIRFLNHLEKQSPGRSGSAPDHGQLLHPQERRGAALAEAEEAQAIPLPFHPHQQFLAEPGGTVLCTDHGTNDPPRNIPQRARSWKRPSTDGWPTGTAIQLRSFGKPLPTSSSTRSDAVKNYPRQETSSARLGIAGLDQGVANREITPESTVSPVRETV